MARNLQSNGPGHNGGPPDGEALKSYVERAARLMTEQKAIGDDLKELCKECDEAGACSKKELRRLARESLMDPEILQSQLERMDLLRHALAGLVDLPLGQSAMREASKPKRRRKEGGPSSTPSITAEREHASADPYAAGREAALHGFNESRNPFDPGSLIGDEWLDGFKSAQSEQSGQAPGNA
jgi:uncharacterized protein (UPF0335 family)